MSEVFGGVEYVKTEKRNEYIKMAWETKRQLEDYVGAL